jgi:hypothetical protein
MNKLQKGFAGLFVVLGIAIVGFGIVGYSLFKGKPGDVQPENVEIKVSDNQSAAPTATPTPEITLTITPTARPRVATAAKTPTVQITPTVVANTVSNCPYALEGPTGALKVIITSKTDYAILWKRVEMYAQSGCKVLVNKSSDKDERDLHSNSGEVTFSQVPAGPYSVKVRYGDGNWTGMYNIDAVAAQTNNLNIELP